MRASLGIGTTPEDLDRLIDALTAITRSGPQAPYRYLPDLDEYQPA